MKKQIAQARATPEQLAALQRARDKKHGIVKARVEENVWCPVHGLLRDETKKCDCNVVVSSDIIKRCPKCDKEFTKLTWKLLDFAYYMDDDAPADPEHPEWGEPQGRLEFRNCECGSTIAIPTKQLEEP